MLESGKLYYLIFTIFYEVDPSEYNTSDCKFRGNGRYMEKVKCIAFEEEQKQQNNVTWQIITWINWKTRKAKNKFVCEQQRIQCMRTNFLISSPWNEYNAYTPEIVQHMLRSGSWSANRTLVEKTAEQKHTSFVSIWFS